MVDIPGDLVKAIQKNRAVAFVGSGLSVPAGGPSWRDLLYELIATAEDRGRPERKLASAFRAVQAGDCLRAATLIADAFQKSELERAIVEAILTRQAFDLCSNPSGAMRLVRRKGRREDRPWHPTPSHRTLLKLNFQAIITTNYDMILERAAVQGAGRITSYSAGSFAKAHSNLVWKQFILHLHGTVDEPGDIVFSQYDYGALFSSGSLQFLRGLLSFSAALWLGFGHGDPDVTEALKQAGCWIGYNYQVVEKRDVLLRRRLDERGITPLLVDSYDEVPAFLAELAKRTGSQPGLSTEPGGALSQGGRKGTLNAKSRKITECFLAQPLARLPERLVPPKVALKGKESILVPDTVFGAWARATAKGRQVAIVAPAAAGKSVLLSCFADWLRKRLETETPDKKLNPIVFFLTPDNLPKSLKKHPLLTQVQNWAAAVTSGYVEVAGSGLLKPWLDAGAVYLLFDGLDEFGARRKGEVGALMAQLSRLARDHNARVFLTCREVFWSQQLRDRYRKQWEKLEIRPLEAADLKDLIPYPRLGPFAYDSAGKPKPGVLNHLLVSFVLALRESGAQPGPFASRHGLYERWARFAIKRECGRLGSNISPDAWFSLFQNTGLNLLRGLTLAVPLPELPNGSRVPYDECMAMEILTPSADRTRVKFRHESINDFFVASSLGDSFRQILKPVADVSELAGLPLAHVDLDFLQTSLYGFLREELGADYLERLKDRFLDPGVFQYKPSMSQLHRNIVEYAGMTFARSQDVPGVADWLLGLMRDPSLDAVIRYNAARALERIHPWAPRPYFDYMSDWGDGDWKSVRDQAETDGLRPWAIRGYRIQRETGQTVDPRTPGKNPALAVLRGKPKNIGLQRHVSEQLSELILGLLGELTSKLNDKMDSDLSSNLNWLLINYTHAWVRWYHPEHGPCLRHAQALAPRSVHPGVLENLTTWVDHPKFRVV
jgi:hypothetical protein